VDLASRISDRGLTAMPSNLGVRFAAPGRWAQAYEATVEPMVIIDTFRWRGSGRS
jgi:hypothetical protein